MKKYDLIFAEFVSKFGNKKILFNGYDVWPLVKAYIGNRVHLLLSNDKNDNISQNLIRKRARILLFILNICYSVYEIISFKKKTNSLAVLTSFQNKRQKIGDVFINQFTDPFLDYFNEINISFDLIEREKLIRWNKIIIFFRRYYHLPKARYDFEKNSELKKYVNEISNYLYDKCEIENIYNMLANILINQIAFTRIIKLYLKKRNYQKILYYCYYDYINIVVNMIAKELNIKTIEYQHSQISSNHYAYSKWNNFCDSTCFPDIFWAWRNIDVQQMRKEFNNFKKYEAIVGGNVAVSKIKSMIKPKLSTGKRILVTMQGIGIPDFIEESVGLNQEYIWHFRMHPRFKYEIKLLESLKEKYPECVEIDSANNLSIYELFLSVKYHITAFSGSAIEAQCFGVQNIIFSEKGLSAYKKQIESRSYYYVENKNQLKDILSNGKISSVSSEEVLTDENAIKDIIKRVFDN